MRAFPLSLKPLKLHHWIAVLMNGAPPPPIPFCMHLSRTVFPLIILHLDISSRLSVWAVVSYWSRKWEMVNCASIFILSGHGDKVPTFVKFKKTNKKTRNKNLMLSGQHWMPFCDTVAVLM